MSFKLAQHCWAKLCQHSTSFPESAFIQWWLSSNIQFFCSPKSLGWVPWLDIDKCLPSLWCKLLSSLASQSFLSGLLATHHATLSSTAYTAAIVNFLKWISDEVAHLLKILMASYCCYNQVQVPNMHNKALYSMESAHLPLSSLSTSHTKFFLLL